MLLICVFMISTPEKCVVDNSDAVLIARTQTCVWLALVKLTQSNVWTTNQQLSLEIKSL